MKTRIAKLIASVALLGLVGCNGGGSDDKKGAAEVPLAPERIYAANFNQPADQNIYCDFSGVAGVQRSLVCSVKQTVYAAACSSPVIQFTEATMCSTLERLIYQQGGLQQCGASALQTFYQQKCSSITNSPNQNNGTTITQPMPILPGQVFDANLKTIECDFEAFRKVQGRWAQFDVNTGHIKIPYSIDSRVYQEFNLRTIPSFLDPGQFGNTKMIFSPAGLQKSADSITIVNSCLNKSTTTSQSGYAGQDVRLEIQNAEDSLRLTIACKGQPQFKKNLSGKPYTMLSCKGESNLGADREKIDVSLPYNKSLLENEISLAENLVMNVSGDTNGQDNARVSLTASGVESDLTIQSSAYLKTSMQLKITSGYSKVNVTCAPY